MAPIGTKGSKKVDTTVKETGSLDNLKFYGDVVVAAGAAKTAIRVLGAELVDTDVGADRALRNLGDTVASVDDEIHPLRQPEEFMFGDFRWPHRNHWDQWAWSIERVAEACCAKVRFTEKYDYLQVEITEKPSSKQQDRALQELANYVELISDYEILTTC